jgi:hypothetical protein
MKFFRLRKTPSENLAFVALMVALEVVLAVLASFVPLSDLFIILVLPLASVLVALLCEESYLWIYLVSALLLVSVSTCYDLRSTLFSILPAIIMGTGYGYCLKRKLPISFVVFFSALLSLGLNYASLPLIKLLYNVDMIEFAKGVLGLSNYTYVDDIVPTFLFGYALAEVALSHLLVQLFFSSFQLDTPHPSWASYAEIIAGLLFASLAIGIGFLFPKMAYVFWAFGVYFSAFAFLSLLECHRPSLFIGVGLLALGSIFLNAACYSQMPGDAGFLLSALFFAAIDIPSLIGRILLKKGKSPVK